MRAATADAGQVDQDRPGYGAEADAGAQGATVEQPQIPAASSSSTATSGPTRGDMGRGSPAELRARLRRSPGLRRRRQGNRSWRVEREGGPVARAIRDGVLEAPAGRGGKVEDGWEAGLQPPPPRAGEVAVLVPYDQRPQPPVAGSAPAHKESSAWAAGCGQAVQELHGAGRCSGQTEVAVKEQGGPDCRERAGADVGVQPAAQPERPGEAKCQERPVQPDRGQAAGLQEPGVAAGPQPTSSTGPSTRSSSACSWAVTGAK